MRQDDFLDKPDLNQLFLGADRDIYGRLEAPDGTRDESVYVIAGVAADEVEARRAP